MSGYVPVNPALGFAPFTELTSPDITSGANSDGKRFPAGMVMDGVDPYFGYGRFIYLKAGAIENPGRLLTIVDQTFVTTDLANTAGLGYPFVVCRQVMPLSAWGWYQFEGVCPIQTANSVAAGVVVGIGGAGQAGTNSAGKQLLNTKVLKASTFTLTKQGTTQNGSKKIIVTNVDGLFVGLTPSGTGIAAGTIESIDPGGLAFNNSAVSTASATVTVTFTYTGFLLVHINCPFGQGAIL